MLVRRALALALVVPLLLAGCSEDEPEPKMPDPPPTSLEPSPSPTETETPEVESAEDFIRRWVAADREMQNTGEIGDYAELSSKCETCMAVAERVEGIYSAGGFVRTDGLQVLRLTDQSSAGGRRILDVTVRSTPTVLKESAGADEQRLSGGTLTYRMRLTRRAPWSLVELTQLAS